MGKHKKAIPNQVTKAFRDSAILNDLTYIDYCNRFSKLALSIFEWENLPDSMNAMAIERSLFYYGSCVFLKDKKLGFINTNCSSTGKVNIYGLPVNLNCYAFEYQTERLLYTGINDEVNQNNSCILVMNNWDRTPTWSTMELFAYRLYEAESTAMTNIKAQKTPVLILIDEKQRLTMENLYMKYEGNMPVIFGDKTQLQPGSITALNTQAPFIADKIIDYKKEIWNEALTYLGINNIMVDKKERLITDEANSNNELINLNLQSYLAPRQQACKQFNELFGLTGDKQIKVKIRSDLHNIIKNTLTTSNNFLEDEEIDLELLQGGVINE